ncbi:MAG: LysM peptidoglycan-binding domain-containing protein, partial [Anaerolinea sp.]|nr:LysM peptidoglycan-binding domain-containing protein [Anaerolinea sp.]
PTLMLPTVTPQPPSPTPTETPGPCRVTVQAGDGLIGLASRCGHRSMDVIPLILELNGLSAPESIQVGQQILIPWPTPTIDPNAPTPTPVGGNVGRRNGADLIFIENVDSAVNGPPTEMPTATATPTDALPPGVTWHVVQPNENMIIIASIYNTNAETLAQLNPEIAFSQCDFSLDTGGPRCTVLLRQGQRMRVPAPTPTPTLSPTLSGSETPTPTATPTFNAPNALSPPDRALFGVDDIITLRWITTGALGPDERYRVTVRDLTSGREFSADTTELLFIIPRDWQGTEQRLYEYEWTVSVISEQSPDTALFTTDPRTFSWQGRVNQ